MSAADTCASLLCGCLLRCTDSPACRRCSCGQSVETGSVIYRFQSLVHSYRLRNRHRPSRSNMNTDHASITAVDRYLGRLVSRGPGGLTNNGCLQVRCQGSDQSGVASEALRANVFRCGAAVSFSICSARLYRPNARTCMLRASPHYWPYSSVSCPARRRGTMWYVAFTQCLRNVMATVPSRRMRFKPACSAYAFAANRS